jgi:hypothetical protein
VIRSGWARARDLSALSLRIQEEGRINVWDGLNRVLRQSMSFNSNISAFLRGRQGSLSLRFSAVVGGGSDSPSLPRKKIDRSKLGWQGRQHAEPVYLMPANELPISLRKMKEWITHGRLSCHLNTQQTCPECNDCFAELADTRIILFVLALWVLYFEVGG